MKSLEWKLAENSRSKSIPELHKEVRDKVRADGDELPAYSSLLLVVEAMFFQSDHQPMMDAGGAEFYPFRVQTTDIRHLVRAVRSVKDGGHSHWPSLDPCGFLRRFGNIIEISEKRRRN